MESPDPMDTTGPLQVHSTPMDIYNPDMDPTDTLAEIIDLNPEVGPAIATLLPDGTRRCQAHSKQSGAQCKRRPIPGGTVCVMHGGKAPQVQAAAAKRLALARDMALDRIIEFLDTKGDRADPRVLLDIATRFTEKVELLEGRATERSETAVQARYEEVRLELSGRLEALADKQTQVAALQEARPTSAPSDPPSTDGPS